MKELQKARKRLKAARLRYEQVCDQLDILNSEATGLESEMLWLQSFIKNKGRRK